MPAVTASIEDDLLASWSSTPGEATAATSDTDP
jgi:hypothetical protein